MFKEHGTCLKSSLGRTSISRTENACWIPNHYYHPPFRAIKFSFRENWRPYGSWVPKEKCCSISRTRLQAMCYKAFSILSLIPQRSLPGWYPVVMFSICITHQKRGGGSSFPQIPSNARGEKRSTELVKQWKTTTPEISLGNLKHPQALTYRYLSKGSPGSNLRNSYKMHSPPFPPQPSPTLPDSIPASLVPTVH